MSFLPIVTRELLGAARKRSTFRVRWWTALIAVGMGFIALAAASGGGGRGAGQGLFNVMTGYAFGLALLSGVALTADSITEEKREGTLGLLFLTNLKGYDVVLGKFMARSLNAFYAMLAILPITALPMIMGGIAGAEFWRKALALLNALFFSLAAGVCVSSLKRDSQRAIGNTLWLLLFLGAGLPIAGIMAQHFGGPTRWLPMAWVSPLYAFIHAAESIYVSHPGRFWGALAASQGLGWAFLAIASLVLPRHWQQKGRQSETWRPRARRGDPKKRAAERQQLLARNPVLWLRSDDLGVQYSAWAVVLAWSVMVLIAMAFLPDNDGLFVLSAYWILPFGFLFKVLFALQSCRFFAEGRRNGALELLVCTPLSTREIVWGQARAIWRAFQWPLTFFLIALFAPHLLRLITAIMVHEISPVLQSLSGSMIGAVYTVRMLADLAAVCWLGTALALTMKKPTLAPALTILYVLVLPAMLWWCDVLCDLFFISWGINKCQQDLRWRLSNQYQAPVTALGRPTRAVPPVIPARQYRGI